MTGMAHTECILDNFGPSKDCHFKACDLPFPFASLIVKLVKCGYTAALQAKTNHVDMGHTQI